MKNASETYQKFQEKNEQAKRLLSELKNFVDEGIELGVDILPDIQKKLKNVLTMMGDNERLKVALIGGFSEGKTSIVAAWTGHYDKNTMKISVQESSDDVTIHILDDDLELIDTPGLFGFKEKENELGKIEKYKEITRKYISEAHLVIYVMDPTNPVKDSHKDELIWLFRTLNLLPRTIFVLNKFDEVADIEDEWEYSENLRIKQDNVTERLESIIQLKQEEKDELHIVGIAANPFGMGTDYWLENREQFNKISHIETLRKATSDVIDNNGGYFPIVYEMQKSIVQDVLINRIELFDEEIQKISKDVLVLRDNSDRTEKELVKIEKNIQEARSGLRDFFQRFFSGLASMVRGCEPENLQEFIDTEVGMDGCIINSKIRDQLEKRTDRVNQSIQYVASNFQSDMNQFESTFQLMGRDGFKFLNNSSFINNINIKIARDGIVSVGKMAGVDLSSVLKFKPWGAVNLAKTLSGALATAGVILQIVDIYKRKKMEEEFNKNLDEMANEFRSAQQKMLAMIDGDEFKKDFFPSYVMLLDSVAALKQGVEELEKSQEKLILWCKKGKKLAEVYYGLT